MKFLSQSKGAKAAAFRSLSEMPGDIAEHPEDDIYVGLSGQNKKLKERLYQLERENLYLKESLQGDIEERRGVMDETTHPKKQ